MTTEFVTQYFNKKIKENKEFIEVTFYDLRIRNKLSEEEVDKFLELAKIELEKLDYNVYFTTAKYTYKGQTKIVQNNEYMIAIKMSNNY